MFADLPGLFDRNFVIGYLLPAAAFVGAFLFVAMTTGVLAIDLRMAEDTPFVAGTAIILTAWVIAVVLLALNREVIRLLSGYGRFNPALIFARYHRRLFQKLSIRCDDLRRLRDEFKQRGETFPDHLRRELIRVSLQAADHFPDDELWLLPTAFGNTMRAIEVYPRVVYGFDGVKGWQRLVAVIPEEFMSRIDSTRAPVNFWANLWVVSGLFVALTGSLLVASGNGLFVLALGSGLIIWLVSPIGARKAAVVWGDYVKAAFDVFLPQLQQKIFGGDAEPMRIERNEWVRLTRILTYRQPWDRAQQPSAPSEAATDSS